jgi:hypothetical protein
MDMDTLDAREHAFACDVRNWLQSQDGELCPFLFQVDSAMDVFYQLCRFAYHLAHPDEIHNIDPASRDAHSRGFNLLISGVKGSGKTRLCKGILNYLAVHHAFVRAIYWNLEADGPALPSSLIRNELRTLEVAVEEGADIKKLIQVRHP